MTARLETEERATAPFATRYQDARSRWLGIAGRFGDAARREYFAHAGTGPDGEALSTDGLWLGRTDAPRLIVLICGTHGIEGYAGSAIQQHLLDGLHQGRFALPADTALLCLHALTPWGMAWYRRCDENGIDLNRNFVDFQSPPDNPEYAQVRQVLQIEDRSERTQALTRLQAALGQRRFEMAVSGGQYQDPQAPFYGGLAPSHGRKVIEQLIEGHALFDRDLQVIDLHTGLGPRGEGELICDHPPGSAGLQASLACFGSQITQPAAGSSSSVPKHGLLDYAWHAGMNDNSFFLTLEFGTSSTEALFESLDNDHRYWAQNTPSGRGDAAWSAVREPMLQHFCPDDPLWRAQVIARSEEVFRRLLQWS